MRRVLTYLGRFAVIAAGFIAAVLAGGLFLALLLGGGSPMDSSGLVLSTTVMTTFIAYFGFLPAMPVILWGELAGKRDWLFYALAGAGVALVLVVVTWGGKRPIGVDPFFSLIMIAAAIVAGLVYWAVAGRSAGKWLHGPDAPTAPMQSGS